MVTLTIFRIKGHLRNRLSALQLWHFVRICMFQWVVDCDSWLSVGWWIWPCIGGRNSWLSVEWWTRPCIGGHFMPQLLFVSPCVDFWCVFGLDFGSFHILCPRILSTWSSFLLNAHFCPSGWTLDWLVACFEVGVDNVYVWKLKCLELEKTKSTEWLSPGPFCQMSSFSFYFILLFATVMLHVST